MPGILALIPTLLPFAIDAIIGVEKLFGHGKGTNKKQVATNVINDGVNVFNQVAGVTSTNSNTVAEIDLIIETVVGVLNSMNILQGPNTVMPQVLKLQ